MLVKAKTNALTKEFSNWTLLIIVVGILSLMFASLANGAPMRNEVPPGTLPPMEEFANPMAPMTPPPESPRDLAPPAGNDFGAIADLWRVLELHRNGDLEEAIVGWQQVKLPREAWRNVGLAAAYLRNGNLEEAATILDYALTMEPNNAVLHYYNAISLLSKAVDAPEWYDAAPTPRMLLAAQTPDRATRASTLYRLGAISEFEKAIELAKVLNLNERLYPPVVFADVPSYGPIGSGVANSMFVMLPNGEYYEPLYQTPMPIEPPTVADLLDAIGADEFEGKAHNMLAPLYLDRGLLQQAEEHMDAAVGLDMNVLDGYRQLADRYDACGQYGDAFRANLKAMGGSDGIVEPARKALDAIRKSLIESW